VSTYYFVGSGIASLAGAAFLIRDAKVAGSDIVIFEESEESGGALDAHGESEIGYFMSGSRMFEEKYTCTFDLLASIPSIDDPSLSVTDETNRSRAALPWDNKARLVNRDGTIADFRRLGFSSTDRFDLIRLMGTPEPLLDSKRISDCFSGAFFETNFWFEWCTLFAFQQWHSAIEFKRYLLRFIHHFSTIDTQRDVYRTRFNQYDSIVVPLVKWLHDRGVRMRFGSVVTGLTFEQKTDRTTVDSLLYDYDGVANRIAFAPGDCVFVTNGSMTADKRFASVEGPKPSSGASGDGAWKLWHALADDRSDFGNPSAFDRHVEESIWESFTVTVSDPTFFRLMRAFSGSEAGEGGLITFKDSAWLLTISIFAQPFFANQTPGTSVWWGYGLFHDAIGDYVKKPMAACSGREILEEVLGHLGFAADREAILNASNVVTCTMPYITSQFLVRRRGDRPFVIPSGSTNLAFIGQYAEVPDDVVFTVEYSIRTAQTAVYALLGVDRRVPPVYKGAHDPRVLVEALETLRR
jgi:oleate hydratase